MVQCQQSHIADEENRVSEKADCMQPESTEVDSIPSLLNHFVSPLWGWISILTLLWGPVIEVLEALTLKLCRIYSILLTVITLNNHIYLWPLFSRVTQTLCHSHPLSVINTHTHTHTYSPGHSQEHVLCQCPALGNWPWRSPAGQLFAWMEPLIKN